MIVFISHEIKNFDITKLRYYRIKILRYYKITLALEIYINEGNKSS